MAGPFSRVDDWWIEVVQQIERSFEPLHRIGPLISSRHVRNARSKFYQFLKMMKHKAIIGRNGHAAGVTLVGPSN